MASASASLEQLILQLLRMLLEPHNLQYFIGGTLNVNTLTGGSWYVLNTAANALLMAGWLIAQVTTAGSIPGQINCPSVPLGGVTKCRFQWLLMALEPGGGSDVVCGCMDESLQLQQMRPTTTVLCAGDPFAELQHYINDADADGV